MEAGRLVFVVTTHIKGTDKKIAVADIMEYSITEKNPLWNICMICKEQEASIWIGTAEKSVKVAEKISLLPYTTEEAGGFVGCTVGMYASSNGSNSNNYAEFFIHNAHPINILRNSVGVQPFSALNTLMKVDGFAKPDCIAASVTDILGSARKGQGKLYSFLI